MPNHTSFYIHDSNNIYQMKVNKGSWTGVNVLVTDLQDKPEYSPNDGFD